jgi:hypothetical protein
MTIPAWLLFLLVLGAVHRLSRLVTADYVTKPMRTWINRRFGENRLSYFITCDWCVSLWIAAVVAPVAIVWPTNRVIIAGLLALTASAFAGNITKLEES